MGSLFVDIALAKNAIIISLFTAIILCVAYIALMSRYSEILCYICIFLTGLGLAGAAVLCWFYRADTLQLRDTLVGATVDELDDLDAKAR